ncbi:MAG: DNA-directed DNA polymerase II small subunit [Methanobrevibacter sp.]|jgi:DNA polymerase II small subunit|nr:DNA-directed DNA polymerase II small subunit [Methanobrevibacter sp.]
MTAEVLLKFAKKGINLSPGAYEKINNLEDPLDFSSTLIVKLKSQEFSKDDLISLEESIVDEFITTLGLRPQNQEKELEAKTQKGLFDYNEEESRPQEAEIKTKEIAIKEEPKERKERKEEKIAKSKDLTEIKEAKELKEGKEIKEKVSQESEEKIAKPENLVEIKEQKEIAIKSNSKANIGSASDSISNASNNPNTFNNSNISNIEFNSNSNSNTNSNINNNTDTNISNTSNNPNDSNAFNTSNTSNVSNVSNINSDSSSDSGSIAIEEIAKPFSVEESKRNMNPIEAEFNFEIIQDTSKQSYTSGDIGNLITYFKNRYDKISGILSKRPDLKTYQKVSDIGEDTKDLSLIVMVKDVRTTKNGHRLVEFEDETGDLPVLFHSDNHDLFREAEKLVKDEIVGIIAEKKGTLAIATRIIKPGVPRIPKKEMDFAAVFTSDIHIGSLTFLEDAFVRFTDWINGDFGTEAQREIANDVKYLIVAGDIVDGIGVYPNQDLELAIKDIRDQYDEAARLLGDIRSDVKIIIGPGNHDASRVAEPQPAVPEKYAKSLYELNNVEFISNPGIVSLDGWNTLIYHGRGFDDMAMTVKEFSHERNDLIMEEMLNKRHLAPIYGERTPLASELEDHLVIDNIPDIFHTGHVHINSYRNYNGVHMINSGTFQTQTEFQKIYNIVPTCAEVPILHKGVYKQLKFI